MKRLLTALLGLTAAIAIVPVATFSLGTDDVRADTSGPNASGYEWIDSNAPNPTVPFEWIDATDGSLLTVITDDDDDWETVTLPFTFNFFGVDYTEADVSSNGFLSFTVNSDCNDNYNWDDVLTPGVDTGHPIPFTDVDCDGDSGWGGNPLIAGWFDDLDPGECGDVYEKTVGTAPDRQYVVEYSDVCHNDCDLCEAGEGVTFEIILFEGSNDIKVQYMDTVFTNDVEASSDLIEENNGGTATTGIGKDDTVGLGYHWGGDDETLSDNLAVLYTTGTADLEVTKTTTATTAKVGDQLTYTITVTNHGPADASGVTVIDDLPDTLTYVSATPSQGTCAEATSVVTCELGNLAADATATVQLVATVAAEGSVANTATVDGDQLDTSIGNNTAVADVSAAPATPTPSPTATPAGLPETGGDPGSGASAPWLLLLVGAAILLASCGFGAMAVRRTR
jgi:uncharacterized repeat protein (TIGR01451 family)